MGAGDPDSRPGSTSPDSSEAPSPLPGELRVGAVFGAGYQVVRRLASGGMGAIYEVVHGATRRRRALKVLLPALVADPAQRERFRREATVTADVKSEHLVEVFDTGIDAATGMPFLVMELLDGEDLGELSARRGPLPGREVVELLAQVARALDRTHAAGIVHRDLKPSNVFLCRRDDGSPWVKVLDFGIAKLALAGADGATNTGALGTPLYMAPEQMRAQRRVGPPADRYALAQLTYRLLAGAAYWDEERQKAESVIGLLVTISRGPREPASARAARRGVTLPPAFDAWFARAAAVRAENRYPDASTMIADLARALDEAVPASLVRPPPSDEPPGSDGAELPPEGAPELTSLAATDDLEDGAAETSAARPDDSFTPPPPSLTPAEAEAPPAGTTLASQAAIVPSEPSSGDLGSAPPDLAPEGSPPAPDASGKPIPGAQARRPWRWALAAVGIASLGLAGGRATRGRPEPSPPPASASAAPTAAPTALTDLPAPASTSAAAIAAYRSGLQEARDGIVVLGGFERALEIDPTLTAAHLQLAARGIYEVDDRARAHFREAQLRRAELSPRDRALLETLEPIVAREPSDWAEAGRRAARATESYPRDAQLWLVRGYLAQGDAAALVHEHTLRALEIDPGYADALGNDGEALAYLGHLDEAAARLDACAEIAGSAYSSCTFLRFEIEAQQGACASLEARARRAIAAGVQLDEGYEYLARALVARAAPADAVREALRASARAAPAPERRSRELSGAIRLALLAGDFVGAERDARAQLDLVASEKRDDVHGVPTHWLGDALAEAGRGEEAARVARAFLDRSDAWEPDPRAEDYAMARDRTPHLLALARDGGQLARAEAASRRDEWLRRWSARARPAFRRFLWMHAFPPLAGSADEAREALAVAAGYDALPAFRPKTLAVAQVGRALLLAGRAAEAIRWLDEATRSCRALEHPVLHTRAHDWLGAAREATGDKAGACAAYQVVLDRWGEAKPRSTTADHARERARALGCPRAGGGR